MQADRNSKLLIVYNIFYRVLRYLRNKTMVPVFYRRIKYTRSGAYEVKHECASTNALITRTRTSTDMLSAIYTGTDVLFRFLDVNTDCASIMLCTSFLKKAYIDRMLYGYAECKHNTHGLRARTHILTDK